MSPAISGRTALVGVLGNPVHHSLSPAMHNAALAELGLDWVYLALPAAADQLEAVLRGLEAVDCRGLNITLPHKQAVAGLCRSLSANSAIYIFPQQSSNQSNDKMTNLPPTTLKSKKIRGIC